MSKETDDKLLTGLFAEYRQMMFKIAMGILHNKSDSEDVVQEAFLWVINNLDKISQILRGSRRGTPASAFTELEKGPLSC